MVACNHGSVCRHGSFLQPPFASGQSHSTASRHEEGGSDDLHFQHPADGLQLRYPLLSFLRLL